MIGIDKGANARGNLNFPRLRHSRETARQSLDDPIFEATQLVEIDLRLSV